MVGLPYPNIKSPELIEKMNYINTTQVYTVYNGVSIWVRAVTAVVD